MDFLSRPMAHCSCAPAKHINISYIWGDYSYMV